jgi:hypothetical protein
VYRSKVREPHFAPSYREKAKQSQFEARIKQVMSIIQKQNPCQNPEYSVLSGFNMKNAFILAS